MTITEALAELKTINKRIEKKKEFVVQYVAQPSVIKDPLENQGGSRVVVAQEMQAVNDLFKRYTTIRTAIQRANLDTVITIGEYTMSIAEWLNWRKEVAQTQAKFFKDISNKAIQSRSMQFNKMPDGTIPQAIINVDEGVIFKTSENIEKVLGELDGILSLKNSTITINI